MTAHAQIIEPVGEGSVSAQIIEPAEDDPVGIDPIVETEDERRTRLSVYHEIKRQLIARGIPEHEIAFIHDYDGPAAMAELSRKLNAGEIRIILASTTKLGVGANIQTRLYATHHGDPPWVPSAIEQRDGRMLRYGNIYPEVHICQYVTEGSFDAYMWQILENKTRFIAQVMRGEAPARTAEEVDVAVLTASQIKAIASGNPLVLEKVGLETELTRLDRLYTTWQAGRNRLRDELASLPDNIGKAEADWRDQLAAIEARNRNMPGNAEVEKRRFEITLLRGATIDELVTFTKRELAGAQIRQLAPAVQHAALKFGMATLLLGEYAGFDVHASAMCKDKAEGLSTGGFVHTWFYLKLKDHRAQYSFNLTDSDAGIIQSMDARLRSLDKLRDQAAAIYQRLIGRKAKIEAELAKGWEYAAKFEDLSARLKALNASMRAKGLDAEEPFYLSELAADALLPLAPELKGIGASVPNLEPAAESIESTAGDQIFESLIEPELPLTPNDITTIPVSLDPASAHQSLKLQIDAVLAVPENGSRQRAATETQPTKAATDWDELFAQRERVKAEREKRPRPKRRNSSLTSSQMSFDWA
jgi:hypothetical protein